MTGAPSASFQCVPLIWGSTLPTPGVVAPQGEFTGDVDNQFDGWRVPPIVPLQGSQQQQVGKLQSAQTRMRDDRLGMFVSWKAVQGDKCAATITLPLLLHSAGRWGFAEHC